mgnify:CR=1 FL=1
MKKMNRVILAGIFIILNGSLCAQEEKNDEIKVSPFQLTFIYPLGTNGILSKEYTHNFSLNLIAGYSGGLEGVELSGFAGHLKNDMKGVQLAGFSNSLLGVGDGVQLSGFSNFIRGNFKGVQISGFSNIVNADAEATQISGFSNIIVGSVTGPQISGYINIVTQNSDYGQISGFVNVTVAESDGMQLAGFTNYSKGNNAGQITGFANVNTRDMKGVQLSGFANVNTGKVDGVQLTGFVNYTQTINGVQLGVFNFVDSLESGIALGVLSFVKNGYSTFEISSGETLYGTVLFKTGLEGFYTMLGAGAAPRRGVLLWGWGFGLGTLIQTSANKNLGIEAISYHINEDEWFTNRVNLLNRLQLTHSWELSGRISIFGGISWNVVVADNRDKSGNPLESSIFPWKVWEKNYGNTDVQMYPGFSAGFRF